MDTVENKVSHNSLVGREVGSSSGRIILTIDNNGNLLTCRWPQDLLQLCYWLLSCLFGTRVDFVDDDQEWDLQGDRQPKVFFSGPDWNNEHNDNMIEGSAGFRKIFPQDDRNPKNYRNHTGWISFWCTEGLITGHLCQKQGYILIKRNRRSCLVRKCYLPSPLLAAITSITTSGA